MGNPSQKTKVTSKKSQAQKDLDAMLKAMSKMSQQIGKQIAQNQPNPNKSNPMPPNVPMAMSPFPTSGSGIAICPRCGHNFRNKVLKDCPDCGLTVAEEDSEGELEWTENMKEPIPDFVYKAQSPEEIFYKSINWHYDKWMKIHKNNPSASIGKI